MEERGALITGEAVVVRGDEDPALLRRVASVTVLVGEPDGTRPEVVDAVDVCLTGSADPPRPWVDAPVEGVLDAVAAHPLEALALASLLRTTEGLDVESGIAAEAATYAALLGSTGHRRWLADHPRRPYRASVGPPVTVERKGDVLHVRLDRPEARNAIDTATRDALVAALAIAAEDPSIAAVDLSGTGPCFSAGGDLTEFGTTTDPAVALAVRLTRHPGAAVARVAARTSVRVHGACVGAGVEVPAFAACVHAAPDTTFRLPELAMGLVPGAGGTASLPRRVGRQRTAWLALTGATIDAATARAWGLVDEVTG